MLSTGFVALNDVRNILEEGRMILHLPVRTSSGSLTRLGPLLAHLGEGRLHYLDYSLPHTVYNPPGVCPGCT